MPQYLLTEEEYQQLREAPGLLEERMNTLLLDLCVRVANHEPIDRDWEPEGTPPRPWGCILTNKNEAGLIGPYTVDRSKEWYCDDCPVQEVYPFKFKHWSK